MSNSLRVAFDARSLASPVLRGWDRYTIGLARALKPLGVEITLLCHPRHPVHETHVATLDCPVMPVGGRQGLWWEQVALPLALRRGHFDLYHAPAEHGIPLMSPCPSVMTLHSATAHSYAELIRTGMLPGVLRDYLGHDADPKRTTVANAYWYAQVARAEHIIAPSEFARDEIVRLVPVPAWRVTTIPLAVDEIFKRPPATEDERRVALKRLGIRQPYLLHVGGYEPHKNVAGLLTAFALVHKERRDLALVVVGSGPAGSDILAAAQTAGLTPDRDVHFLSGVVQELPVLYEAAELFVSLSWRESFGLPALEAMTRGTAVVASAWGAAPEVVGAGGTLVDPRDSPAFRDAVIALLADPARGERAREAATRFSWDNAASATLSVYRDVISRATTRVPPANA